jgi:hypothetical protein
LFTGFGPALMTFTPRSRSLAFAWLLAASIAAALSGCAVIPDVTHQPRFHNPFPQLHRVAVLPFYNQSREPTLDGEAVAIAYYNELQLIPGFEVMPIGVTRQYLAALQFEPRTGADYQKLAQVMNVDAVVVGSITEYTPYYPPRIGMSVDWYAANPGFHPIPVGYGLPWGTADEEFIPENLLQEAEFALAREQLATQTPLPAIVEGEVKGVAAVAPELLPPGEPAARSVADELALPAMAALPAEWPDPRGFVPPAPSAERPEFAPQARPVMTHTRLYDGKDSNFTAQLERYYYQHDDARFAGWKGYMQRPEDFFRFCCHLHVTETLAARGGAGKSRVMVRWPIRRYER